MASISPKSLFAIEHKNDFIDAYIWMCLTTTGFVTCVVVQAFAFIGLQANSRNRP